MAILGFDRVTLVVDDLGRAVRFYRDVLGAELVELLDHAALRRLGPDAAAVADRTEHAIVRFGRGPSLRLVVSSRRTADRADRSRWGFTVAPTELAGFGRRLDAAGVVHRGPVRIGPLGPASVYLHDPAGNLLELATTGYTGEVAV